MLSAIAIAAFAALATAQDLDWDVVLQATPIADVTVPAVYASAQSAVATATTVSYSSAAAIASVTSALAADPSDSFPLNSALEKRATTTSCATQPTGAGPSVSPDNASNFLSYTAFATSASQAATPSGYVNTFTNLQASNNAYGYLGYTLLSSYDTALCAQKCTAINACQAFNIYFERDPSVNPDSDSCSDPASTTQIKCVFWSGPVSSDNANNVGQYQNDFHVVIAGSNGYVNQSIATPAGFSGANFLGTSSINAPLDCAGDDTFLQSQMFTGQFDASLCAAACSAQNGYAYAHPASDGTVKACKFFNTYVMYKNANTLLGQYCALYSETWSSSYATNTGYYYGSDHYTIAFSYTFSNKTDTGKPRISCDVASASSAIKTSSLQPFCSTLLGYSALLGTTTAVSTPTTTATTLVTVVSTVTAAEKRDIAARVAAVSTPAALTKYSASAVSSACSLIVSKASTTSYTTATVTGAAVTSFATSTVTTATTINN